MHASSDDRVSIVVTIPPLAEFVEQVGGEVVDVSVLVPQGASPHTYEPTPSQLVEVSRADALVKVGTQIEFEVAWLDALIATNNDIRVIDASQGIDLSEFDADHDEDADFDEHSHAHEGIDPHVWTSPKNAMRMVRTIRDRVVELAPEHKTLFERNANAYLKRLVALDESVTQALQNKRHRAFLVYHPAWGYFANDYGLEQVSVEVEGKEPSLKSLGGVIRRAQSEGLRVIFADPQFDTRSAQVIAKEVGGEVVLISPLDREYLAGMRVVSKAIADSMK